MEILAKSNFVQIGPRKMRLVADLIRGLKAQVALDILKNLDKKSALPLLLTLKQAIGNATNNFHLDKESLIIKKLEIGGAPMLKRGRPVSRGRWHRILKRASHISLVLEGEKMKKGAKNGK